MGIGPKVIPEQLKEIAGGKDGVINVASFENLSKELRKLREVTCSEFKMFLTLTSELLIEFSTGKKIITIDYAPKMIYQFHKLN